MVMYRLVPVLNGISIRGLEHYHITGDLRVTLQMAFMVVAV